MNGGFDTVRECGYQPLPCEKKPAKPTSDTNVTRYSYWPFIGDAICAFLSGHYDLDECSRIIAEVVYAEVQKALTRGEQ